MRQIGHLALDTGAGRQYKDTTCAGVGADGLADMLHMGTESGGCRQSKSRMGLPT